MIWRPKHNNDCGLPADAPIEFNEAYVIFAKQAGAHGVEGANFHIGRPMLIQSATVSSGPSWSGCEGNVFAQ
jgi:hypothetical protein